MKKNTSHILTIFILTFIAGITGCLDLDYSDSTTPEALARTVFKTIVKKDRETFKKLIYQRPKDIKGITEKEIKRSQKYNNEDLNQMMGLWVDLRRKAESDGVFWDTATYEKSTIKKETSRDGTIAADVHLFLNYNDVKYRIHFLTIKQESGWAILQDIRWRGDKIQHYQP